MIFQRWKRELDTLRRSADERAAVALPVAICRWFDLNRRSDVDDATADELASIRRDIEESGFHLADWHLHTDAYGWRFMMQRYIRDGAAHYLLLVTRDSKPSERDLRRRDQMIRHLGADPVAEYLLSARSDDDPDTLDLWTWRTP